MTHPPPSIATVPIDGSSPPPAADRSRPVLSLADIVRVDSNYSRSTNLERDTGSAAVLDGYLLTGRALDMVERVTTALNSSTGGAWSVTGPYGSGKSSLGVFLAALYTNPDAYLDSDDGAGSGVGSRAQGMVAAIDPHLADGVDRARTTHGASFLDGLVTARTEPVTHTVTRALQRATLNAFGTMPTRRRFPEIVLLRAAIAAATADDPRRMGPSPGSLLDIAVALARRAPLLLIVDEFGKNLEAAQQRVDADLYLLQLLAEAANTDRGAPIVLITLQHLAFGDYAAAADTATQREWSKIQGRFEDVVFVDTSTQTRQLITHVYTHTPAIKGAVGRWAHREAAAMADVQLFDVADADLLAACYPIHPVAVAVLPELCRRYGQNERSLFGFLAGGDRHAVTDLLSATPVADSDRLPTVGLDALYDYFATATAAATARTSRWSEITVKLRDVAGIPADQVALAKAVAVLNLASTTGPLRASPTLLATVHSDAEALLDALVRADVVVYRETTDEYRVWHGSDVDLTATLSAARRHAASLGAAELLNSCAPLDAVMATGHSLRTDTLCTFDRRYLTAGDPVTELAADSSYDGRLYIALNPDRRLPENVSGRPICVHDPGDPGVVDDLVAAARELYAYDLVLADSAVVDDWVASGEITERRATAHTHLTAAASAAWNVGVTTLIDADGHHRLTASGVAALSEAAGRVYTATVPVGNETLNRVEVTSIGAKARRLLIHAMLTNESDEQLGLSGHGAEVAMYRSVLKSSGIHAYNPTAGVWRIRPPKDDRFSAAWKAVEDHLRSATDHRINVADLYAVLQSPPFGMKPGPIPVIVTAALIATSDEVALYEHGTFKPALTGEVSDRLVRNPTHFEVKHFASAQPGARRQAVEKLASRLGIAPRFRKSRVHNVIAVVGALVTTVARLPAITLNTTRLNPHTVAVRDAIVAAIEPDRLLFADLPEAVGFSPIPARAASWAHLDTFAERVAAAIGELGRYFDTTLAKLRTELFERAGESDRTVLAARARPLVDDIDDQGLRTFALAVADGGFDDARWIENIATTLTRTAVKHWDDRHHRRFAAELAERLDAFGRLELVQRHLGDHSDDGDVRRVTVTRAGGDENAVFVTLTNDDRDRLKHVWDTMIDELVTVYGSRVAAEKVALGFATDTIANPAADTTTSDTMSSDAVFNSDDITSSVDHDPTAVESEESNPPPN